jgi:hypothetical protein
MARAITRAADTPVNLVLRLPPELHRQLRDEAARNNQSLNSEMIRRLEESLHRPRLDPLVDTVRKITADASDATFSAMLNVDQGSRQELLGATKDLRKVLDLLWEFRKDEPFGVLHKELFKDKGEKK